MKKIELEQENEQLRKTIRFLREDEAITKTANSDLEEFLNKSKYENKSLVDEIEKVKTRKSELSQINQKKTITITNLNNLLEKQSYEIQELKNTIGEKESEMATTTARVNIISQIVSDITTGRLY